MRNFITFFILGLFLSLGYYLLINKKVTFPIIQSLKQKEIFSFDKAPKDSLKGTIQSLSGLVKWESRIATEEVALKKEILIQQGETISTGEDGNINLEYTDRAILKIASQSAISIIQTLPTNLVFNQIDGTIEYKKLGQTPISIRSFHLIIIFDGEIMIAVDKITGLITINVRKGSAQVGYNDLQYISEVENLTEGQIYEFDDAKREGI